MGKKDTITKEYLRKPAIFADAFNQFLYHGRQVIQPEKLVGIDTAEIVLPYGEGDAAVPEQKYRDVLKLAMTDGNAAYCILGCENQDAIHYAMPVKNMVYDSMQLAQQVTRAAQSHKKKKGNADRSYVPSTGEYLSGFYKTDHLLPVVTLTIFWGPEKWDAPLSLREMYSAADEAVMQYAPDYTVNLLAPGQMAEEEIGEFRTSLKEVMLYIKYSQNKERLQEITRENPRFRCLDRQAAEVINITTNSRLRYPEGKERIDMCAAIEEMRYESRLEGEIKGIIETYKEVGVSVQEAAQRIAAKFNISLQKSEEEVKKYWQD